MAKRKIQASFLVLSIMAGLMSFAAPANAAAVTTVSLVSGSEVLAGVQSLFKFKVTNTETPGVGKTINHVMITARDEGDFVVANGSAPGWNFDIHNDNGRFRGGSIAPGASLDFEIIANVSRPATDLVAEWLVASSSDNGATQQAPAIAPSSLIKVLEVTEVAVTAPSGVTDGTATASQQNLSYRTVVRNAGSGAPSVTGTLTSNGAGDTITGPGAQTIPAGATRNFVFDVDLGAAGNRTFTADAAAAGADANSLASAPLTVENAPAFTYTNNTLAPLASASGVSQTFLLSVTKTNPPGVTFDKANTDLCFSQTGGGSFCTSALATPNNVARTTGTAPQAAGLVFAPLSIPGAGAGFPDGLYDPTLTITGTDDNGAALSRTVSIGNDFEIDNLAPVVDLTLAAPSGQTAVKNGDTLTFGGTAKKSGAAGAANDPTAVITDCDLVIKNSAFVEVNRIQNLHSTNDCRLNAGNVQGSFAPAALGVPEGIIELHMTARDGAGNATAGYAISDFVNIDNLVPGIAGALTGCGANTTGPRGFGTCNDTQTIVVSLTEPVTGDFLAGDFRVDGNSVLAAESNCTSTVPCGSVTLRLANALGNDDEPGITYTAPTQPAPLRNRPRDGAKNQLAAIINLNAADGIVPDLPDVNGVTQGGLDANGGAAESSYAATAGSFYTNQVAPTFSITGLGAQYNAVDRRGHQRQQRVRPWRRPTDRRLHDGRSGQHDQSSALRGEPPARRRR